MMLCKLVVHQACNFRRDASCDNKVEPIIWEWLTIFIIANTRNRLAWLQPVLPSPASASPRKEGSPMAQHYHVLGDHPGQPQQRRRVAIMAHALYSNDTVAQLQDSLVTFVVLRLKNYQAARKAQLD